MLYLKQSTASQSVLLGPFVDDTDGATPETGLTIANTDIRLSANGGNMFAKTSGGGTHDENGWYTITLDATDTATVGRLQVSSKVAGALTVFSEFQIVEESVFDNFYAAAAVGPLTAVQVNAEADQALTDYDGPTNAEMIARTILAAAYFDPVADAVANVTLVVTTTTNTDMRGTDGANTLVPLAAATDQAEHDATQASLVTLQADTDDIQSRLPAALVGGAMDSDVSVIQSAAAQTIRDEILPTQNVAFDNLQFLFVAASDHVTPVTGATGTGVTRTIDGGAFGAGTGTLAEVGNGIYQYDASAADMNGGIITFRFTASGGTPGAPDDSFVTIVTTGGV